MSEEAASPVQSAYGHLFPHGELAELPYPQLLPALRSTLAAASAALDAEFRNGAEIRELIHARAWLVDQVLILWWQAQPFPKDANIALLAVGGYGRGELHPQSDIDLLILSATHLTEEEEPAAEAFLTGLWDLKLIIGHAVRTVDECVALAREDITIATNLMESRVLTGSAELGEQLQALTGPEQIWPTNEFFSAKWQEQKTRHRKYNDTEYNLEPNIKGAPGGLRDIQTVGWVAKRHFNAQSFEDLVELGFLNFPEYRTLLECQDLLWRLRYALHMITERPEDRLLFDHQRSLAALFGLEDSEESLSVEKLMKDYYRAAQQVTHVNDLLLQHFDEAILRAGETEFIEPLNDRFQVRNSYIEIVERTVFDRCPFALIEVFVLLARNPHIQGVRAQTARMIRLHSERIDERMRHDTLFTALFLELLRAPDSAVQLQRMQRYGLLSSWLPEFGAVMGRMQHDLFHIYTVDAHTLLVVKNMQELMRPEALERFPEPARVAQSLPRAELLYIAGLFHDIAKGRGGDHSELGASDVRSFAARMHLSEREADLLAWLVEKHLVLSMTAQRKDISDPSIIHDFAEQVGDSLRLDYLYALTVADICATNPNLWNGWRASLLRQLYVETRRALQRGLDKPVDRQASIEATQQEAMALLAEANVNARAVQKFWDQLGDDYFLQDLPEDIAWHTQAILAHGTCSDPLILLREGNRLGGGGGTSLFIYTRDQANLFAATAAALDQLHLDIHDARILTSVSNFSMDTYIVLEENGQGVADDPERIAQIQTTLFEALRNPDEYPRLVQRHTPRQLRHFNMPTRVSISNDPARRVTVLELITPDRPGLLARVGRIFMELGISLHTAKISTLGERVEDIFYLSDHDGHPLSDPALCARLRDTLRDALDAHTGAERTSV